MTRFARPSPEAWNISLYPARLLLVAFIGVYLVVLGVVPSVIPLPIVMGGVALYGLTIAGLWRHYGARELPPRTRWAVTALDNALMLLVVPLDPLAGLPLMMLVVINPFEFSVRYHAEHLLSGYLGALMAVAGILVLRSLAAPGLDVAVVGVLLLLGFIVPYGLLTAFGHTVVQQELVRAQAFLQVAVDASGIGFWSYDVAQDRVELDDSEVALIQPQPGEFNGTAASFVGMVEPEEREEVAEVFAAIAADGQQRMVRLRRQLPDGSTRWMMGGGRAVEFDGDKPSRIVGATIDVTELVEAQRAEETFRERHDKALNSAQISCWYWDAASNTMEFDDWAHEQMGVNRDELLPTVEGFAQLVYDDDRPIVQKEIEDSIAFLESFDVQFRVKNRLPKIHWRRTYGKVFRDEAGVCIGFSGVVMDVTPEMELRADLEDTSRLLDRSLSSSHSVAWTLDMAGKTGTFYGDVRSLIGLPPGPPLDAFQAIAGQVHAEDEARVREHLINAAQDGGIVDIRFRVPHGQTGESLWMHAQGSAATDKRGQFDGITGIMRDVTTEERALQELRVLGERFRSAVEAGGIGTWSYDVAAGKVEIDDRLAEVLDVPLADFDGRIESFMGLVHADDQAATNVALAELAEHSTPQQLRFRRQRSDGSLAWVQVLASAARSDKSGRATRIAGASYDVTELVDALGAEAEFRERHNQVLNSADVSCWYWDAATDTLEFEDWTERLLGVERGSMKPTMGGFAELVLEDDRPRIVQAVTDIVESQDTFREEYRAKNNHTRVHWLRSYGRVFRDADGVCTGLSGVIMDITKEMELRQALEHSNAELDDFAHIASHDLREPLRGLHNYAQFLQEDYADKLDDEGRHMLTSLGRLAQRLESLIGALQQYARLGRAEQAVTPTDLNTVLDEVLETTAFSLEDAGVTVARSEPLPTWDCEGARIGEVFRNLINNGVKYNDAEAKQITIGFDDAQQAVYVRDNGIGIAPEHHDRVFTMFKRLHTRDQYGGGTGSGLTLTQRIIERHGGRIWFESEPGAGTTFYFSLPQGGPQ